MIFQNTSLYGLKLIIPELKSDYRGFFIRSFCKDTFEKAGLPEIEFVQINQSYNIRKGTFRGLHYQRFPAEEEKLVKCVKGAIFDIVLDVRQGSKTYLQWEGFELNDQNHHMLFIPKGFAHGFITLKSNTIVSYHHTTNYQPKMEAGISIFDPRISIKLPTDIKVISKRDKEHPFLTEDFY